MTGREFPSTLRHKISRLKASRSFVIAAILALSLITGSGLALHRVAADRSNSAAKFGAGATTFYLNEGTSSVVVGEFEGVYEKVSRRVRVRRALAGGSDMPGSFRLQSRSNPGSEVPQGGGYSFGVVNSAFINSGDNPGTVTGEVQITNNTNASLLNTRIVFTAFKIGGKDGPDAGNMPGQSGFAYFNDGLVAFDGKLNVSRYYGDIPPGGNVRKIWTFATGSQPPGFFFAYKVIADLGVAAESVMPAAVQVNALSGSSVVINGRGFSGLPAVQLLPASGSPIAMTNVSFTSTQVTATVPPGTAPGVYSVRVTSPGGTPGGAGSSTLVNKLTVTGAPDGAHTLSGTINSLPDAGPYFISGNATINSGVTVPAGAVFYIGSGATITIGAGGNLTANGGVPGVPGGAGIAAPSQIVFTAQRSPGAGFPVKGAWGGINAVSTSSAEMILRNVVVEFGGQSGNAQINITGSGRKLRFTDSISRNSGGAGISAGGTNDSILGFARNRIEHNGVGIGDAAVLLSGNSSLGLYELPGAGIPTGTNVGDAFYFYSSANDFADNNLNALQIGSDGDAVSNDFTRSGVLVGQGEIPIRIRGNCDNPAIVGAAPPASPAELTITPGTLIQLAPGVDLKAADYPSNKIGSIAANGYAGAYLGQQPATSNKLIEFDKVPGSGNFGAIFFSRNALPNSILNYVRVQNGGSSCTLGNGEVIAENIAMKITNSEINNGPTGGLREILGAQVDATGTTFNGVTPIIDTIAGGLLGNGNLGDKASLVTPTVVAVDPLGRGIFLADSPSGVSIIRFLNTTRSTQNIGALRVPGGAIVNLAGGGSDFGENAPTSNSDVGNVTGLAVSANGELIYFIDSSFSTIRAINISTAPKLIAGAQVNPDSIGTFSASIELGSSLNGLAISSSTGDIYVADATPANNKVFSFPADNPSFDAAPQTIAGTGDITGTGDPFNAGDATNVDLLQPRAIVIDASDNLYIADTGHGRIIKVSPSGTASLVAQFPAKSDPSGTPYKINPFTSGLAIHNGKILIANGNTQDITRIDTPGSPAALTLIAGKIGQSCDYTSSNCGDGGLAIDGIFSMIGSTGSSPLAGIASDSNGVYILDQGNNQRGRVRYVNLTNSPVEVAGVTVNPNIIDTIAGSGLTPPFDGGLASSAAFSSPLGVGVDQNGNLWITDTLSSKLRFVNRTLSTITVFAGTAAEQVAPPNTVILINKNVGSGNTDDVPANLAGFDSPQGVALTSQGVFIADSRKGPAILGADGRRTGLIRFINTTSQTVTFYQNSAEAIHVPPGYIKTIAGGSKEESPAAIGDGPNPLNAKFLGPSDVATAPNGDIYIADAGQRRVRKIERSSGIVSSLMLPSNSPNEYTGLSFDSTGRLLVANAGGKQILREKNPGSGSGVNGFDIILSAGPLSRPRDVVQGKDGNLYVSNAGDTSPASAGDHEILKITVVNNIGTATVVAGSNSSGYSGDGGPAVNARLNITSQPINIATLGATVSVRTTINIIATQTGEIIFCDSVNNAIRRIR